LPSGNARPKPTDHAALRAPEQGFAIVGRLLRPYDRPCQQFESGRSNRTHGFVPEAAPSKWIAPGRRGRLARSPPGGRRVARGAASGHGGAFASIVRGFFHPFLVLEKNRC